MFRNTSNGRLAVPRPRKAIKLLPPDKDSIAFKIKSPLLAVATGTFCPAKSLFITQNRSASISASATTMTSSGRDDFFNVLFGKRMGLVSFFPFAA